MSDTSHDWLRVVYRPDLELEGAEGGSGGAGERVVIRLSPPAIDLEGARGRERRHRVTVVPGEPGLSWRLYLLAWGETTGGESGGATRRAWWKPDGGTWQPLTAGRALVAEGRGRARVDVALRLEGDAGPVPRLRFGAEVAG